MKLVRAFEVAIMLTLLTTDYFQEVDVSSYGIAIFKVDKGLQLVHRNKNETGVCNLREDSLPSVLKWDEGRWV
jgi:hypothetical protein